MATTTSNYFPLASETNFNIPDPAPGTAGAGPISGSDGDAAGASGSSGSYEISHGAMAAIIVIVCVISLMGIGSSILFYIAKKREWTIRETIRRSARKVVSVLTPRRSEFPRSAKGPGPSGRSRRGRTKLADVPPTPSIKLEELDLEQGSRHSDRRIGKPSRK